MIDIDRAFHEAEDLAVRDLWPEIQARRPSADAPSPRPGSRLAAIVIALVIGTVGIGLAIKALSGFKDGPAKPSPTPIVRIVGSRPVLMYDVATGGPGLYAVDPVTREARTLAKCPNPIARYLVGGGNGYACLGPAAWSPTGTALAYTVNCIVISQSHSLCDRRSGIWVVRGGEPAYQVTSFENARQGNYDDEGYRVTFAWSPDGSRIAYVSSAGGGGLYVADAGGTGSTRRLATLAKPLLTTPVWSPDGSRIAYEDQGEVHLVSPDGSARVAVSLGTDPAWSADGAFLAFVRGDEIDVIGPDGTGPTKVGDGDEFAWSPVSDRIAYLASRFDRSCMTQGIWTVSADGSDPTSVLSPACFSSDISPGSLGWSPDGAWIVFLADAWRLTTADGSTARVSMEDLQQIDDFQRMTWWNRCRCTSELQGYWRPHPGATEGGP